MSVTLATLTKTQTHTHTHTHTEKEITYEHKTTKKKRKEVWDGGQTHLESPSGVQGWSPGRSLGDEVPQKLKNFESSYKQLLRLLVVFHTFSPIYAYVFFVLAGIIPLSLRNGGHLIPFAPLSATVIL